MQPDAYRLSLTRARVLSVPRPLVELAPNLVVLDLSRNRIECLGFLRGLLRLRSLSLYMNRVSAPAELHALASLVQLSNLDMRLNPVASRESHRRYVGRGRWA